jgi:hypothetical protein
MGYGSEKRQQTADRVHALAKEIKRLLRARTHLPLSVETAAVWEEYGSIRISLPWRLATELSREEYHAACVELQRLMGFEDHQNELHFGTYAAKEYLQRAAGTWPLT